MRPSYAAASRVEPLEPRCHLSAVAVSSDQVPESTGLVTFHLTLDAPADKPLVVQYATVPQGAKARKDFTPTRGRAVFAAGQTITDVVVPIIDDDLYEANDTFRLDARLIGRGGNKASGSATILNDEAPPLVRIDSMFTYGGRRVAMDVYLYGRSELPVSVSFQTEDGPAQTDWGTVGAVAGVDYEAASGTMTFRPKLKPTSTVSFEGRILGYQKLGRIPLRILSKAEGGAYRGFYVRLTEPVNAALTADDQAFVTITPRIHGVGGGWFG